MNVGFASLTMNKALGFSSTVYGFGGHPLGRCGRADRYSAGDGPGFDHGDAGDRRDGTGFDWADILEPADGHAVRHGGGRGALINALGNLGGFVGPYMFGLVRDATGGWNVLRRRR